ncbi:carboxypeptidase-like regulatory domain-containing protein [Myroides sp. 1354]|uniref:TonB-dependent receptor n=1 Tax=unclassified Myroides TaxID=2642485 RepID=UPI002577E647|nr:MULTISPECIES: TonB-dependent receptor [unclassified Myroides]MDM1043530.1 carboxypeptidase-like regulatory domain-containing protein [Myroides sp. R163-1]MDM1054420.1 carboxypeptidase-like regulatory domain-containing protein [Myroides sp. 1354]MDM1067716.1 carboxypeptidase-like regulatory domain-containing protein [Myroides sp. 1372]
MRNLKNWMLFIVMVITSTSAFSQNKVKGTVIDGELSMSLPGATVLVKGTQNGVSTDANGAFTLNVNNDKGEVVISFIGYQSKTVAYKVDANKVATLGNIVLNPDENMLADIVIMGVADVAKDRKTPVAVSTIKAAVIQEKLGSQEFPEVLNTTPSVYTTKGGGGFGDSRINIRGFDQKNIAVMVNGMPINDMENSSVYWSNWAGLSDVTSAMQVQRGLGSSKLAISSIGGTINILTRTADAKEGGSLSAGVGNDNFFKGTASYSTGILDNGLSASVLLSHSFGDGYVRGTDFSASNYFVGLGYQTKDAKHNVQFTFTGAPQTHSQRYSYVTLQEFLDQGEGGDPNIRYNKDWGYLNGQVYNARENYYHKPVMSLNYDWLINETTKLSAVVYGSWGRGGGGGLTGKIVGPKDPKTGKDTSLYADTQLDANGQLRMDDIVEYNSGRSNPFGGPVKANTYNDANTGITKLNSVNSHNWYGTIINLNKKLNENFTLDFGVDARTYKGFHFQNVSDFLGATGYKETLDLNYDKNGYIITDSYGSKVSYNPWASKNDKGIAKYNNDGNVRWYGAFTQLEYSKDNFTAFIQGAISNQDFQRVDNFIKDGRTVDNSGRDLPEWKQQAKTSWKSILGGNVKGGVNYNIDENHNVFGNIGYYSKQPFFNGVYINNTNQLNPDLMNEKIFGVELGYGYRSAIFNANVNLYRTSWEDRIERRSVSVEFVDANGKTTRQSANVQLNGLAQLHQGVEVDFNVRPLDKMTINGAFSYGDWNYTKDVKNATILDRDTNEAVIDPNTGKPIVKDLYLKDSKVGDSAQMMASLGIDYEVVQGLKFDATYRYVDKLYSKIDIMSMAEKDNKGALKLPSFNLFDLGMTFTMKVGKEKQNSVVVRANVNNVFDKIYITESNTSKHAKTEGDFEKVEDYNKYRATSTWKGIDTSNQVWFGTGRTWNVTLRYNF